MSSDREVNRIVRSWLEEGVTALPDRVLDNVLDQLPATPQRRVLWPARRPNSMNALRIAIAAAAVLAVAIAGINLLPGPSVGTGPTPSASPTPSTRPTPNPTVSLLPGQLAVPLGGEPLAAGTYSVQYPFPIRMSFTVGEGWTSWSGTTTSAVALYKGSADPPAGFGFGLLLVDNVVIDACNEFKGQLDPPLGPTPDDLASALAIQPMTDSSPVTDVSIDGHTGRYLEYTMNGVVEPGCVEGQSLVRWHGRQALLNEHDRVWIVDVDGVRLVIDAFSFPGTTPADHAELQAVIDSIQIE